MTNIDDRYDFIVQRPPPKRPSGNLPFDGNLLLTSEDIPAGLSFADAMAVKYDLVRQFGPEISLTLVPSAYRVPLVAFADARKIALAERERLIRDGMPLDDILQGGFDWERWWQFRSPHHDWQEEGLIPGIYFIYIDKLTGAISTSEQVSALNRAQAVPKLYDWDPELWGNPEIVLEGYKITSEPKRGHVCAIRSGSAPGVPGLVGHLGVISPSDLTPTVREFAPEHGREWSFDFLNSTGRLVVRRGLGGFVE